MYAVAVVLPAVQAEFGVARVGRVAALHADHDRLRPRRHPDGPPVRPLRRHGAGADRRGRPRRSASSPPACAASLWQFALAQGLLIGLLGSSATFAPLLADTSLWFTRRRGIAVAICASGNYLAGAVWPPVRAALHRHRRAGARPISASASFCVATMLPLALSRCGRRPPVAAAGRDGRAQARSPTAARLLAGARCRRCSASPGVCLLRRDVDAAGAHRRLLRRPRLRRRARRADAVADARLRHRQPARLGLDLRPHRRPAHAAARLRRCRASRCCCSCRSTASCRCTSSRRCSACSRAASCPPTPSSCASTSRRAKPARASAR